MIKKERIFELKIEEDDELSGIDSISLVSEPAIEINWLAFNRECQDGCGLSHDFSSDDHRYVEHIMSNAETEEDLFNDGWVVDSFEISTGRESFVSTDPNAPSIEDEKEYKVRYKYVLNPDINGPELIATSRDFCKELIRQNKVFRVEDIENATNDFGQSPLVYRGSWNCRHVWQRIKYRKDADIINKASVNKGKVTVGGFPNDLIDPDYRVLGYAQPSTVTNRTLDNPSPSTIRNLGLSKDKFQEECPEATQNVAVNLENRQRAIDEANYGPLNPNEPNEDYWKAKAKMFNGDVESAKKARCGNCAFFVKTPSMLECIAGGINDVNQLDTIKAADLGYCEAYDFKCAAARTCDAWVVGGPIIEEDFVGRRISIDFDDTLSTQRGQRLAQDILRERNDLYVVTRRNSFESAGVYRVTDLLGIPRNKVIFTNGKLKWETLRRLGITKHIDNNPDEIAEIKKNAPLIEAIQFDYDVSNLPAYKDELPTGKTESFESYTDYPESAKNNAKRALDWADKNGWGSCGTDVGKQRANQLAKGEAISEETIARMASFERHRQNKDVPYSEGCGGLMWDAWGGTSGIEWAQNKLERIRKEKMSKQKFAATDEEKRIVIGPAMVPHQKIIRKDKITGEPYYVFFSPDTIKMIADKYMKNQYTRNNDTEHDGKAVNDIYVTESWIVEDEKYDKSKKYGFEVPVGSWMVAMKIPKTEKGEEVWQKIKAGELNGFSVSGYFEEVAKFTKEEMFLFKLEEILKQTGNN
jgi:hypothetical protein